ncbi:MAG: cytochrome c oxidase subunit II [Pseudomonadota bacterium]
MRTILNRAKKVLVAGSVLGCAIALSTTAFAQQPVDWQLSLQDSATPVMDEIRWLNYFTLAIITIITLFVLGLLVYCFMKFNAGKNPTPSKVTHNTTIEVVWTVVPILILMVIVAPSLRLLYKQETLPEPDVTVKVVAYQWYWGYAYPDLEIDEYISTILHDKEDPEAALQLRQEKASERGESIDNYPRLLAVDNELVVPVGAVVQLDMTSADVLHAIAVPSFGIKMDAVPGRLNSLWFKAEKEGLYYGQCSQICGTDHAFMPIAVRVVDEETFKNWAASAAEDLDLGWEILAADIRRDTKSTQLANN